MRDLKHRMSGAALFGIRCRVLTQLSAWGDCLALIEPGLHDPSVSEICDPSRNFCLICCTADPFEAARMDKRWKISFSQLGVEDSIRGSSSGQWCGNFEESVEKL